MDLFPYQKEGARFLASRKTALLADEMGLGKSAQAITACDLINAERILVLCPASATVNWLREFGTFSKLSRKWTRILSGEHLPTPQESVVCSYDLAAMNSTKWPGPWDCLILDESHYLKNLEAKRTRAILGKEGLAHKAKRTWALSGTPAPNHAAELWPLLRAFGRTSLPYTDFVKRYCHYYIHGRDRLQISGTKPAMIPEIRALLSPIILRRMKEDVMKELPPITYEHMTVEPNEVDARIIAEFAPWVFPTDRTAELMKELSEKEKLLRDVIDTLGGTRRGMMALEALAGSVSTLRIYTGVQKLRAIASMVDNELDNRAYEKIVIFAVHRAVIEGLRDRLSRWGAVTLYGRTPPNQRQKVIDKFQNNPRTRIFIGNIAAAGTAINLTAAHHVLFAEQDWVPGNNAQAAMRCHRIGQKYPVSVRFVGLAGSIDERITRALKNKTSQLTAIFNHERLQIPFDAATDEDVLEMNAGDEEISSTPAVETENP